MIKLKLSKFYCGLEPTLVKQAMSAHDVVFCFLFFTLDQLEFLNCGIFLSLIVDLVSMPCDCLLV